MREAPQNPRDGALRRSRYLGFALLALAFLMWVPVPVALSPPPPAARKGWAALLVAGEVAFWISAVVPEREVVRRYRAYLDPRRLFRRGNS